MAYGEESRISLPITNYGNSVTSTDWLILGYLASVGSNGEVFANMVIPYSRCKLKRVGVLVTEAFTASCIIKVWKEAIADASGIATFTMGATAIDQVVYVNIADTILQGGEYISWELDTQDTTTGIIMPFALVEVVPETAANITKMITTGGAAGAT